MCGRFKRHSRFWDRIYEILSMTAPAPDVHGDDEVRPTDLYPIIGTGPEGYTLKPARWSLIPRSHTGPVKDFKLTTFNARIETATTSKVFATPWRKRHCLVPADAFWEWSGEKARKQKWQITRADNHPLMFAGLWDRAETSDGPVTSFTILTRPAGEDMAPIHNREPVILHPDQWRDWLDLAPIADLAQPARTGTFRPQALQPDTATGSLL
ncbi:SOS response-associated peptidase [Asticcacaulis machinosus]|uniref:Abasic site processing protein n=1 Tax=Asticcacaulis machinosus TaxID=2984211 RepID=A0ABT5HKZ4_9CAUL|nr:SOS response-associated peptidase [Asticcacaulis machinosus]MDC7676925.1 SOS response-associated peptidase [Asticcacaulis machinosus]